MYLFFILNLSLEHYLSNDMWYLRVLVLLK